MPNTYLRGQVDGQLVALGPRLFRKQILRMGRWNHPSAPDGVLEVTPDLVKGVADNFKRRVRDDVPVPMGHDLDALDSAGHVVGLEAADDGLWGIIEFKDEEAARKVEQGTITGGSALIAMNHVDQESGDEHGPTLVHWALTNAPYIKGLAGYERVALGENEKDDGVVVISLSQSEEKIEMDLQELLKQISEVSDEDLQKALREARPDLFNDDGSPDQEAIEKAKAEGATEKETEMVAALAEKGISIKLSEKEGENEGEPEIKLDDHPVVVALAEQVKTLTTKNAEKDAETVIDQAIKDRKVLPAQKEGLMAVALGENGMEHLEKLIPEAKVVDTSEHGVTVTEEPGVELSEDDAKAEADRIVKEYASTGKSKEN